jgi:hypothetical protein
LLAHPLSIVAFDEPGSAVEGILKFGELVFLLDEGGIGVFRSLSNRNGPEPLIDAFADRCQERGIAVRQEGKVGPAVKVPGELPAPSHIAENCYL